MGRLRVIAQADGNGLGRFALVAGRVHPPERQPPLPWLWNGDAEARQAVPALVMGDAGVAVHRAEFVRRRDDRRPIWLQRVRPADLEVVGVPPRLAFVHSDVDAVGW